MSRGLGDVYKRQPLQVRTLKLLKEILHMQQSEIYGIRIKIVYQEKKLKVCIKIFRN